MKEYTLKLQEHELTMLVEALESEKEIARDLVCYDSKERATVEDVVSVINGILDKINKL